MSKGCRAIILLSGGVDSTLLLALAKKEGKALIALSFDYGQKHRIELEYAKKLAKDYEAVHEIVHVTLPWGHTSSLLGGGEVETNRSSDQRAARATPSTYVPGRNTLFLSFAFSLAESIGAEEIHHGANKQDHNPYPDCRPEYFQKLQALFHVAASKAPPLIKTPLLYKTKEEIYKMARECSVSIENTFSCYNPFEKEPCLVCDACLTRQEAIKRSFSSS